MTDDTGQYRIENLPPGTYTLTFTLPASPPSARSSERLGVLTDQPDMRVGGIQETITVTGESPVVDTQTSTRRQMVLSSEVIPGDPRVSRLWQPAGHGAGHSGHVLDVSSGVSTNFFTARGGRGNEGTIQIDGMNVGSAFNGGGVAGFGYPIGESSEIQVTISGGLGEVDRGGPQFNHPEDRRQQLQRHGILSTAGKWSQGDNLDRRAGGFGLTNVPALIKNWDTNFARWSDQDRLWFFNNVRSYGNQQEIPVCSAT